MVLTAEESRKFLTFVKNKATVNAPLDGIYEAVGKIPARGNLPPEPIYSSQRGAFALLVSTNRAMREPFSGGAGDK